MLNLYFVISTNFILIVESMLRMVDTIYRNDTDVDTIYAERGGFSMENLAR